MPLITRGGKIVTAGGKLATSANCCCNGPGACCIFSVCSTKTKADCIAAGGTYHGQGTPCSPNPCPPCRTGTFTLDVSITGKRPTLITTGCTSPGNCDGGHPCDAECVGAVDANCVSSGSKFCTYYINFTGSLSTGGQLVVPASPPVACELDPDPSVPMDFPSGLSYVTPQRFTGSPPACTDIGCLAVPCSNDLSAALTIRPPSVSEPYWRIYNLSASYFDHVFFGPVIFATNLNVGADPNGTHSFTANLWNMSGSGGPNHISCGTATATLVLDIP
jgi:hypothetical protein